MSERTTPTAVRQAGPGELEVVWADGHVSRFEVVFLRRACRCAHCVDEWSGQQILKPESVSADVRPRRIEPVGRYAIHIDWSDGHSSGIYSFDYLRQLCPCEPCRSEEGGT